jgi:hypothetical protein
MNIKATRIIIILVGLVFLVAVAFGIISGLSVDNQAIKDYLEGMAPVAQAHLQWLDDYEALTENYAVLSTSEKVDELNKLLDRIEEIQIDVEASTPPSALAGVQNKWNQECVQIVQAIFLLSMGVERNMPGWITEAYEYLMEADQLRKEWVDELSGLLDKYNIGVSDFPLSGYYKKVT